MHRQGVRARSLAAGLADRDLSLGRVTEAASVVAALAAVGALYFAWRTVSEARDAHRESERDRRLNRIAELALALTQFAADLDDAPVARARITQARARVLWVAADGGFGEHTRAALVTELTPEGAGAVAADARAAIDALLTGLDDYLAA